MTAGTTPGATDEPAEAQTGTQDGPLLAQHETTTNEQVEGILAQTRADLGEQPAARYAEVLRQRFTDAGIAVTDEQIANLARRAGASGSTHGV